MLAKEVMAYWRRVHRRAFDETKYMLRIETGARAMIAISVAACLIAVIWFIGGPNIAYHEVVVRLSLIATILLAFPVVYGWQFITTPAKLDDEATEKITQYEQRRAALNIGNPYLVRDVSDAVSWMI